MSRPTEDELIATYFAPLAGEGGLGLKDDAALIRPSPGHDLVTTVDGLVAGVHFFPDDPAASIAVKALGVNLSDLAAKGAVPIGFLLALALPPDWTTEWLRDFVAGLGQFATAAGCPLLGGDTVQTSGPLMLSITVFGEVPAGRMVRRAGSRPGDRLYVSGTIGDAALGLKLRSSGVAPLWLLGEADRAALLDRYLHPSPRLALAEALREYANAAMDISDGLIGDAAKMAAASNVAARIDLGRVPLSPGARAVIGADPGEMETVVTGGDDYEILSSVAPGRALEFEAAASNAGVKVTAIGEIAAGPNTLTVMDRAGLPATFKRGSFTHF